MLGATSIHPGLHEQGQEPLEPGVGRYVGRGLQESPEQPWGMEEMHRGGYLMNVAVGYTCGST